MRTDWREATLGEVCTKIGSFILLALIYGA